MLTSLLQREGRRGEGEGERETGRQTDTHTHHSKTVENQDREKITKRLQNKDTMFSKYQP